jgi:hypothetical protein
MALPDLMDLTSLRRDASVSPMLKRGRLREAATRQGMKQVNVWLPEAMYQALVRARAGEGRESLNEAIREAVRAWIARREAGRGHSKQKGRER